MELDIVDLSVSVEGRTVLRGVSFKVLDGECMGVVGPNGSGKTALLQSLAGLHDHSGSVFFGGRDLRDVDLCREGVFYLSDDCKAFDMTVRENLELYYRCYSGMRDPTRMEGDIDGILEAVRLKGRQDSHADSLSLGMRRRLAYAMTMVSVPSVLIMDDPFSNLDTDGRIYLEGYLRTLKLLGTTMVIGSHDLMNLQNVCDTVLLIQAGRTRGTMRIDDGVDLEQQYLAAMRGDAQ